MRLTIASPLLRTSFRRYTSSPTASSSISTASTTASAVGSKTAEAGKKVGEMLQNAGKSVGPVASNALGTLKRLGGRTGSMVGMIEGLIPPTRNALLTSREIAKIVYRERGMNPPSLSEVQAHLPVLKQTLSERIIPTLTSLSALRNVLKPENVKNGTLIAAEVLGFFTVGEMLGRWKIVGYRGKVDHHN